MESNIVQSEHLIRYIGKVYLHLEVVAINNDTGHI